jgi:hypothetical protein
MSDTIIVGLIAAGASIIGTLVSHLKNADTNKKKFKTLYLLPLLPLQPSPFILPLPSVLILQHSISQAL